jgi:hypothetical protein
MRVKIGNVWHDATPESPILVELTTKDLVNIRTMDRDKHLYASFHEDGEMDRDRRIEWMRDGSVYGSMEKQDDGH